MSNAPGPRPTIDDKEFHNEFETHDVEKVGLIRSTKITIETDFVEMAQTVRVDLCDHPLYPKLEAYVLGNRRRIQKGKR